jgi:phosphate transport system permease protein
VSQYLPDPETFQRQLKARHLRGSLWRRFFFMAILIGILALITLLGNVVNEMVGLRAVQYEIEPDTLTGGKPLESLSAEELLGVLNEGMPFSRRRVLIRDRILGENFNPDTLTTTPMRELLAGKVYPEETAELTLRDLNEVQVGQILLMNLGQQGLLDVINDEVVKFQVVESWTLLQSLFERPMIEAEAAADYPDAHLQFRSWLDFSFLTRTMSSTPSEAGVRTALLGTLWLMGLTILIAFPLGVGAAIYMEEYAKNTKLNGLIETNIRNLAGVPSIIYGLLGLAVFVRVLEGITQGRTILSGAATMALLILPVIIINAQEALRAVPSSLREASYGLGATQWQTIWRTVLPAATPGILTGTILATSRAIGETAPLIVVGASTFILFNPEGPLSKFTALPIQIYDWTKQADPQFRDIAAAAIVVLLVMLLLMNAAAIYFRQRFSRKLQG